MEAHRPMCFCFFPMMESNGDVMSRRDPDYAVLSNEFNRVMAPNKGGVAPTDWTTPERTALSAGVGSVTVHTIAHEGTRYATSIDGMDNLLELRRITNRAIREQRKFDKETRAKLEAVDYSKRVSQQNA
jgi:hypothetical protein